MRATGAPVLLAALLSGPAAAQERDPWLGPDKALHFSLSAALAGGGYALGAALFEEVPPRLAMGAGLALGLGIAKELYDLTGAGTPSWKDLTWDAIGVATGLAIAWAIDRFVLPKLWPRSRPPATAALRPAPLQFAWSGLTRR
jgi:uncharacterized protein YfiM (DUF2279 family)